jgi:hypothetical protein
VYTNEAGETITIDNTSENIKYVYVERQPKFGIIDIIAYAGGIWFFLS